MLHSPRIRGDELIAQAEKWVCHSIAFIWQGTLFDSQWCNAPGGVDCVTPTSSMSGYAQQPGAVSPPLLYSSTVNKLLIIAPYVGRMSAAHP